MKFTCALTGITDPGVDPADFVASLDDLGAAPIGWTRVVIERRVANPKWSTLQLAKSSQLESVGAQLRASGMPEDVVNVQYAVASYTIDATFHAVEKDTPPFHIIREEVWVADHVDALEPWNEVRAGLSLPVIAEEDWGDDPAVEESAAPAAE